MVQMQKSDWGRDTRKRGSQGSSTPVPSLGRVARSQDAPRGCVRRLAPVLGAHGSPGLSPVCVLCVWRTGLHAPALGCAGVTQPVTHQPSSQQPPRRGAHITARKAQGKMRGCTQREKGGHQHSGRGKGLAWWGWQDTGLGVSLLNLPSDSGSCPLLGTLPACPSSPLGLGDGSRCAA